jgi:hypothetical protein
VIININYDSSVTPQIQAELEPAVNAAVAYYEHVFTNPITITVNVGWGEVDGQTITGGALAESQSDHDTDLSYSQVYAALANDRNTEDNVVAFGSLPASDPTDNPLAQYDTTSAEMEALGLSDSNVGPANDLYIGLNSSVAWTFDPSNRAVSGAYDAIGAIEHEMTEVMGRVGSLGTYDGINKYTILDLFRYASAGERQLSPGLGWFSIDGQNLLKEYNDPRFGGDAGDWNSQYQGDSYGFGATGAISRVTDIDLQEVNVLGYDRRPVTLDNFNGNGVSDILFWNAASGDFTFANMQGSLLSWADIGGSNTAYTAVGTGDFLGDRISDVLFRNNSTGDTWFAEMSDVGLLGAWVEIGGSDTYYSVAGTGDFFGNAIDDILFRNNSTGDTWLEALSDGAFDGWYHIGAADTHYSVAGIGDFLGNGTDDILFRNDSTGDTWIEKISNGSFNGWAQVGGSDTNYAIAGVGDFFDNGTDDILFRNNSTGDTWIEAISNGAFAGWYQVGGSNTSYAVVATGDYYGNGTSDILFRNNNTGDTWYEAISNGAPALSPFTSSSWHQVAVTDTAYKVVT